MIKNKWNDGARRVNGFLSCALLLLATTARAQEILPPVPEADLPGVDSPTTDAPVIPNEPLSGVTPPGGTLPPASSGDAIFDSDASSGLADERNEAAAQTPPLSLIEAITLSLRNNPQREAAVNALLAAEARIGTAKSAGGLQVGLSGSADYQRSFGGSSGGGGVVIPGDGTGNGGNVGGGANFGFSTRGSNFTKSLGINAQYPIYSGGRVKAGRRVAEANARVLAAQTLVIEQTLVQSTISSYLNVLRTGQLLDVAESDLSVSRERRRVAGVRFAAGAAARLEVLTANTQLAAAQQRRVSASNNLAQAKATLNILMGRVPETPVRVEPVAVLTPRVPLPAGIVPSIETPAGVLPVNATSEQLREIAAAANPALAVNQFQIEAAQANIDVARAQKKPSFDLSLSGLLRDPITSAGRFLLSIGLGVAQSLFDSGRATSQVREARALTEQARDNLDTQRLQVAVEIEQSLLTLDSAQKRLASADAAVDEAREALRAAQLGYEAGVQTNLDVSDAQAQLLATQTEAANARFDVANAQAQLSAAVGVLTLEGQTAYEQALQERTQVEERRLAALKTKKK